MQKILHRLYRDFRGLPVGKAEYPGGDAAKGHALQPLFRRQVQAGPVAGGQLRPVPPGHSPLDDGPHSMEHIAAGQVEGRGTFGLPCGLLMALALHQLVAEQPELDAAAGVDDICYAYLNHTFHPHFPEKNHHSPLLSSPL